jgi:hypothetical protein
MRVYATSSFAVGGEHFQEGEEHELPKDAALAVIYAGRARVVREETEEAPASGGRTLTAG